MINMGNNQIYSNTRGEMHFVLRTFGVANAPDIRHSGI